MCISKPLVKTKIVHYLISLITHEVRDNVKVVVVLFSIVI